MEKSLWTFEGYVTAAQNQPVQDWFYEELDIDERDLIRDRINRLKYLERHLWKLPLFGSAGDSIWEIRRDTKSGWIRMYGVFHPTKRHCFVFLCGNDKDTKNDKHAKKLAIERLGLLNNKIGETHEFEFEERAVAEDSTGASDEGPAGSVESFRGYRFPNPSNKG